MSKLKSLLNFMENSNHNDYPGLRELLQHTFGQYRELPEGDPLKNYMDDALKICEGARRDDLTQRQLEVFKRQYVYPKQQTRRQISLDLYCDVSTIRRDTEAALDQIMIAVFGPRGIKVGQQPTYNELAAQVITDVMQELPQLLGEGYHNALAGCRCISENKDTNSNQLNPET